MKAPQPDALQSEPVAYLWQHTITGQTKALMRDDVFTAGPHWRLVGPLHLATESGQAVPAVASAEQSRELLACVGCGHLYEVPGISACCCGANPRNEYTEWVAVPKQAARASAVPIHVIELGKQVSESAVKQLVECLQQNENRFRPMTTGLQNSPHGRIDREPQRQFLLQEERDRRIYIAGPMTGIEDYNFPAFNRAAGMLRESGWVVENPADHGVVEGATWSDYLAYDLARLGTCGAVYLLRGWQNSKGARLEYLIAKELGMVIIEEWS